MKRSEMLDLLNDIIEDCHNEEYKPCYFDANRLLNAIEKVGMTMLSWEQVTEVYRHPPTITNEPKGSYGWEDDNEKK